MDNTMTLPVKEDIASRDAGPSCHAATEAQAVAGPVHQELVNLGGRLKAVEDHLASRLPLYKDLSRLEPRAFKSPSKSNNDRPTVRESAGTAIPANPEQEKQYLRPSRLVEWDDFFHVQAKVQYDVVTLLGQNEREYRLPSFSEPAGGYVWGSAEIHAVQVEEPIMETIELLKAHPYGRQFHLDKGLLFQKHINWLAENGREVYARRQDKVIFPDAIPEGPENTDLRMVYRLRQDDRELDETTKMNNPGELLYFYDLHLVKSMSMNQIQFGLKAFEMAVRADTVAPYSEDENWLLYVCRTQHVIDAVSRVYQYMLEAGLSFSYLTNGPTFVFLNINWNDPTVLRYKVVEPGPMAEHHIHNQLYCHPAMQVLAFSLYSLTRQVVGQDQRHRAIAQLRHLPAITADLYTNRRTHITRVLHDATIQARLSQRVYPDMDMNPFTRIDDMQRAHDGGYGTHIPQLYYRPRELPVQLNAWCTQKCLHGLLLDHYMDPMCPNFSYHLGDRHSASDAPLKMVPHPQKHKDWIIGLAVQFAWSLDHGIIPLNKQTNRMVFFQVTDRKHRYVLLTKATADELYADVVDEELSFFSVRDLQGIDEGGVPVHLGSINLLLRAGARAYFADHRTYLNHFSLFSWSGTPVIDTLRPKPKFPFKKIAKAFHTTLMNIQNRNLAHCNIKPSKLLWDVATEKFYLCDLSKALMGKRPEIYMTKEELDLDINGGIPFDHTKDWLENGIVSLDWSCLEMALAESIHPGMDFLEHGGIWGLMMRLYGETTATARLLDTGSRARRREGMGEGSGPSSLDKVAGAGAQEEVNFADFVYDGDFFVLDPVGRSSAGVDPKGKGVDHFHQPGRGAFRDFVNDQQDPGRAHRASQAMVDRKGKGVDRRS
jgi:hypothetical protein